MARQIECKMGNEVSFQGCVGRVRDARTGADTKQRIGGYVLFTSEAEKIYSGAPIQGAGVAIQPELHEAFGDIRRINERTLRLTTKEGDRIEPITVVATYVPRSGSGVPEKKQRWVEVREALRNIAQNHVIIRALTRIGC